MNEEESKTAPPEDSTTTNTNTNTGSAGSKVSSSTSGTKGNTTATTATTGKDTKDSSSSSKTIEKYDPNSTKSRVLKNKQRKKLEEQKRKEKELKQIIEQNRVANAEARNRAKNQYRPSSAIQNIFGNSKKIEEDYSMYDQVEGKLISYTLLCNFICFMSLGYLKHT